MADERESVWFSSSRRRANRTILVRTLFLLTLFGVAASCRCWSGSGRSRSATTTNTRNGGGAADRRQHGEANRGTIYDRSGETLAMSATVYNIQLSPKRSGLPGGVSREGGEPQQNGKTLDYPDNEPSGSLPPTWPSSGSGRGGHPNRLTPDQLHV